MDCDGSCKTKVIQPDLGIFTHIPACLDIFKHIQISLRHILRIIQACSGILRILCNSGIFRTQVYLETWHIPNQRHIQNIADEAFYENS